jgi:flagellar biosynthesis protein FlhG
MNHPPAQPRILAVASGKGGVGKTSFTLNLAALLAKQGHRVLVVDGDIGLANADVQLNLQPAHDLADVLARKLPLAEALTPTPHGFHLLAGRAGHQGLANLPLAQLHLFLNDLTPVAQQFTLTLIDAAAGLNPHVLALCSRAGATLLLTTPDPSSLTDAYALVKLLWQQFGTANAHLIVNQATAREAASTHRKIATAMESFLHLPAPKLLGAIPTDRLYATAVKTHQLAAAAFPQCPAVLALQQLIPHLPR